jgi:hypothetical protein
MTYFKTVTMFLRMRKVLARCSDWRLDSTRASIYDDILIRSIFCLRYRQTFNEDSWFESRRRKNVFIYTKVSRLALGPSKLPTQWVL